MKDGFGLLRLVFGWLDKKRPLINTCRYVSFRIELVDCGYGLITDIFCKVLTSYMQAHSS